MDVLLCRKVFPVSETPPARVPPYNQEAKGNVFITASFHQRSEEIKLEWNEDKLISLTRQGGQRTPCPASLMSSSSEGERAGQHLSQDPPPRPPTAGTAEWHQHGMVQLGLCREPLRTMSSRPSHCLLPP